MNEKLTDWERKKIWELSCAIGEWSADEEAADEDPLPRITQIVNGLYRRLEHYQDIDLKKDLSEEDLIPIYRLMISSMLYASEIELHKRENADLMKKFEKQRDAVAKAFPFTDEDQDRWR